MKRILINSSSSLHHHQTKRYLTNKPKSHPDYQTILQDKTKSHQNLIHRKSNLRFSDCINDLNYLIIESTSLNSKLIEAKQRQNHLSEQIKRILLQSQSEADTKTDDNSNLINAQSISTHHQEASLLKSSISDLTQDLKSLNNRLTTLAISIPNQTHPSVPIGPYSNSRIIKTSNGFNLNSDTFDFHSFKPIERDSKRDHLKIMNQLNWISSDQAQKSTGSQFLFFLNSACFLELALIQFTLQLILRSGDWKIIFGPDLIKTHFLELCGFHPRDLVELNQTYYVSNSISSFHSTSTENSQNSETSTPSSDSLPHLSLSATSELPIISSFHSTTLPNSSYPNFPTQPIKLISLGTSFRSEAGARGIESKGLYRLHQFKKVEMVCLTSNDIEISEGMLKEMLEIQIQIIESLGLPYRVLEMSSEELGNSAFHKFDIETWMPSRGKWGEITSASNCTDYQSRRLNIRYQSDLNSSNSNNSNKSNKSSKKKSNETEFVHSLNATGIAIPRIMMSLIENGYMEEKDRVRIRLPKVLKPFWLGGEDQEICWI
ncbi:seryl-tRNA synthetase [Melampsora americana]|nr:seryl-tRNA synthetase [Melampsora americana]